MPTNYFVGLFYKEKNLRLDFYGLAKKTQHGMGWNGDFGFVISKGEPGHDHPFSCAVLIIFHGTITWIFLWRIGSEIQGPLPDLVLYQIV